MEPVKETDDEKRKINKGTVKSIITFSCAAAFFALLANVAHFDFIASVNAVLAGTFLFATLICVLDAFLKRNNRRLFPKERKKL